MTARFLCYIVAYVTITAFFSDDNAQFSIIYLGGFAFALPAIIIDAVFTISSRRSDTKKPGQCRA